MSNTGGWASHSNVYERVYVPGVRVLFQVAVVLVRRCLGEARQRKECEGQMETLEQLRAVRGRVQHEPTDAFIQEVSSVFRTMAGLFILPVKYLLCMTLLIMPNAAVFKSHAYI